MNKIIVDGDTRLFRWDTQRRIAIESDDTYNYVHFSQGAMCETVEPYEEDGKTYANIPNIMLQRANVINVYLFEEDVSLDRSLLRTLERFELVIVDRPKPSDYVYIETKTVTLQDNILEALRIAHESGEFKGDKGDQGIPGHSPVVTTARATDKTIVYIDGVASAEIPDGQRGERGEQGIPGRDGVDGRDGRTPVKGTDYFTASEISEFKAAVTPVKNRDYFDGERGPQGIQGVPGERGPTGATGSTGPKGDKGDKGDTGSTGPRGLQGEAGHSPVITASKSGRATTIYADGVAIAIVLDGEPGSGSGDMSASVYDSHGKRVDIFDYVDNAVSSVPKSWNDITDKPNTFPPSTHTHSQYLTEETDPTVPSWAKASTKPTYTAEEVGALPEDKVFWATYGTTTYAEITQAVADGKIILLWYSNRLYKYGGLSTYHYFVCDLTATSSYYARVNSSNTWSASSSTALTSSIYVKSTATTAASDSNVYTALRTKNELDGKSNTDHTHSQYLTEESDPTVPSFVKSITEADIAKWNAAGGGVEIFWVTYGSTTYNEIAQAVAAGKLLLMRKDNTLWLYGGYSSWTYYFVRHDGPYNFRYVTMEDDIGWTTESVFAPLDKGYLTEDETRGLRKTELSATEKNPAFNGQIVWVYE